MLFSLRIDMKLTSKTDHLKALDQAHHLHPFTNLQEYASDGGRIISKVEHIYIFDSDGNQMLDGMSGLCAAT